ncbi:hypothetical protein F3Y22_tig00110009pilonHSYRG00326 [Hibiscus syriacus]|uniref:DYW domain-containing protein n=1 Tax=Hibiscus syriacus TaxID=106335 RepID=A0A6A3BRG4_HIBSY|nr:hypothetical protein F3Y22_tig00110009pilonHSYRG00326 [Hibiscus syriacus]
MRVLLPHKAISSLRLYHRCLQIQPRSLQTARTLCHRPFEYLSFAISVFRRIPTPFTNDFNAIIRGLIQSPQPSTAFAWYRAMQRGSFRVDALTCSFTLKACARVLAATESLQLHANIIRFGFMADALLGTTLLDVLAKVGSLRCARLVFDEMRLRDIASWNSLIFGLAQGSQASEALDLFKRMQVEGLKPNEVTVIGVLSACSHMGDFKEGEKKCLVTWNTMIMAFARDGDGHKTLKLFEQMEKDGVQSDAVTYLAVLCACNHAGLVEDGLRLFNTMGKHGVKPNLKHYGSLVDLLGRAGRLKDAYNLINSMSMMPDVVLWQSLLGACRIYKDVEMAEIASRNLMHKFFTGDKSNARWKEIYSKLDEIRFKIKELGYVAETSFVLHDIGEEEEEENQLCYRSEKLAVASGLISTSERTPILVIKNLRICGDIMSLTSKPLPVALKERKAYEFLVAYLIWERTAESSCTLCLGVDGCRAEENYSCARCHSRDEERDGPVKSIEQETLKWVIVKGHNCIGNNQSMIGSGHDGIEGWIMVPDASAVDVNYSKNREY